MGKFVISQAKNGVKFNLKAANGEVIASSQVYKDEKYCRKGIASRSRPVNTVQLGRAATWAAKTTNRRGANEGCCGHRPTPAAATAARKTP